MDIKQEIFEKAKLVCREQLSESAELILMEMCEAAYSELLSRLKEEASVDVIYDEFVRAAAVLGVALFVGLGTDSTDSFSAGNVTLKKRGEAANQKLSESMRRQAELMLRGYLKDNGFFFGTVRS